MVHPESGANVSTINVGEVDHDEVALIAVPRIRTWFDPVAAEYGKLKQALVRRYRFDREACTDARKPLIRIIVDLALSRQAPAGGS